MRRVSPFKSLDLFRGFAALWVVMDHSCDRWLASADPHFMHVPLYAFSIRGQLGVMLFFVISGYCITAAAYGAMLSGKSVWRYAYDRVRRIYPPYLVTVILTALSLLAIAIANRHHWIPPVNHPQALPANALSWVANLLLLQSELHTPSINVVFWSLCYEIAFYLFVGFFLAAAHAAARRSKTAGAYVLLHTIGISTVLTLVLLLVYPSLLFPFELWHQFSIGGLLFFLLEWNTETVPGFSKPMRWMVIGYFTLCLVLMAAYAILRVTGGEDVGHPDSRVRSIVSLLFIAVLIALRRFDDSVASSAVLRPLMWIGAFSYSLYLIHPIVLPYLDVLCRKAGLNGPRYWITFWIQVGVSVFAGRVFYLLVERWFISKRQVQRHAAEHVS